MSILEIVKRAGVGAIEATNPVAVLFGQVIETTPLSVLIDQRFILPEEFVLVPDSMKERKVVLGTEELIINKGLEKNDRLLLLRVQGGQQYIVIDRVVNA